MKKLFISFTTAISVGLFAACNNSNSSNSKSSESQSKKEGKKKAPEKKSVTKAISSGSSSSSRNSYLRVSHNEWISMNISDKKIQNNNDFKSSYNAWKTTDDGQSALGDAYLSSNEPAKAFQSWKTTNGEREGMPQNLQNQLVKAKQTMPIKFIIDELKLMKG